MSQQRDQRRPDDPSAGGKRSGMRPGEDPGDAFTQIATLDSTTDAGAAYPAVSMDRGLDVLRRAVATLPGGPGVYRMLSPSGEPLYVGKARNLKRRVTTYTRPRRLPYRLQRMVSQTASLEIVTTHTEVEALLLESNLVKRFNPPFNVQLRDDKSFPYIHLTGDHDVPRIRKHRGARTQPGDYFGPFASAGAVDRTITALEKAFLLRSCSDHVYANRSRPCLKYHIKRCSAPCVGYISGEAYAELVQQARDFLAGRDQRVQDDLKAAMNASAERHDFETAAIYRDRLRALAHIQTHQDVNVAGVDDADVIALHQEGGETCIQVFFVRAGRNYGNRAYFPAHERAMAPGGILAAFVAQFYDDKPVPPQLLLSHAPHGHTTLADALGERAGRKVALRVPQRGEKRRVVEHAVSNAREALSRHLAESATLRKQLDALAERLGLESTPERVEVYDNSHTQGSQPYGAMVVAGPDGLRKKQYRTFKIRGEGRADGEAGNDDHAMMREVLTRRFRRAVKEDPDNTQGGWPDLVLLDGGRGQLNVALAVFAELGITGVAVAGVAKGPEREAGREEIVLPEREPMLLHKDDPASYLVQRLSAEAHRFAVGTHRKGRQQRDLRSSLDDIDGVGAKRKRALLLHFGSAREVARAGLADLEAVEGINQAVAKRVYDHFHEV